MTLPIPREALPVVHRLRLEVERPALASGLLLEVNQLDPFPDDASVGAFFWWTVRDPQSATDAIWPPDGRWCRACGDRPLDPVLHRAPVLLACPECEREFCVECIDAEGDYDGESWRQVVYPCGGCREVGT